MPQNTPLALISELKPDSHSATPQPAHRRADRL
jgi:hypothetical protein